MQGRWPLYLYYKKLFLETRLTKRETVSGELVDLLRTRFHDSEHQSEAVSTAKMAA